MKIIRKQFGDNSELISKSVIKKDASNKDWRAIVEKCRNKCSCSHIGMPNMTVWANKVSMHTRTGHHFQFEFVQ